MKKIEVERKLLEDVLDALSSARDHLTAVDTAQATLILFPVVNLSPLTKLVERQVGRVEVLLRPEFPGEDG